MGGDPDVMVGEALDMDPFIGHMFETNHTANMRVVILGLGKASSSHYTEICDVGKFLDLLYTMICEMKKI